MITLDYIREDGSHHDLHYNTNCEWFAGCANVADYIVSHPIIGDVPCCKRCAYVVSMPESRRVTK